MKQSPKGALAGSAQGFPRCSGLVFTSWQRGRLGHLCPRSLSGGGLRVLGKFVVLKISEILLMKDDLGGLELGGLVEG